MKASTKGYTQAGILGLLAGLSVVALGAFVVTGQVIATPGSDVVSDDEPRLVQPDSNLPAPLANRRRR